MYDVKIHRIGAISIGLLPPPSGLAAQLPPVPQESAKAHPPAPDDASRVAGRILATPGGIGTPPTGGQLQRLVSR